MQHFRSAAILQQWPGDDRNAWMGTLSDLAPGYRPFAAIEHTKELFPPKQRLEATVCKGYHGLHKAHMKFGLGAAKPYRDVGLKKLIRTSAGHHD